MLLMRLGDGNKVILIKCNLFIEIVHVQSKYCPHLSPFLSFIVWFCTQIITTLNCFVFFFVFVAGGKEHTQRRVFVSLIIRKYISNIFI